MGCTKNEARAKKWKRGWGREKEGTLARKPLDFEERLLVFTVEFISDFVTELKITIVL